jgi:hypothetical protein
MFEPGMIVQTVYPEWDIEFIPAGTKITLERPNDVKAEYWYGATMLNGRERVVLVLANNLKLV